MTNQTRIKVFTESTVRDLLLPYLPLVARQGYDYFIRKLSQGYYPADESKIPGLTDYYSSFLSIDREVVYTVTNSNFTEVTVVWVGISAEKEEWVSKQLAQQSRKAKRRLSEIFRPFDKFLDNLSRGMTIQQILSASAWLLGVITALILAIK